MKNYTNKQQRFTTPEDGWGDYANTSNKLPVHTSELTKEYTHSGNQLIAEFMGLSLGSGQYKFPTGYGSSINDYQKYHSSWEWLMPVVKKIVHMYADKREKIFEGLCDCDIQKTFEAVVEFIKFWNNPDEPKYKWDNVVFPYDPEPKGQIL